MTIISHPRQLALLDFGSVASGVGPDPTGPASKLSALRQPPNPPPIRNEERGPSEPACAVVAMTVALPVSEDRSSQRVICPGLRATALPMLVRSFAAHDCACDAESAGLPVQMADQRDATMTVGVHDEPRMQVTEPTQERVGDVPSSGSSDLGSEAHGRGVETVHPSLFSETGCEATVLQGPTIWLRDPVEDSLIKLQVAHFSELVRKANKNDRDPLKIAETIMRVDKLPLVEIVNRGPLWLAERLRQGLLHRHTGKPREITDPDARARRVHYALDRLKEGNPNDPELLKVECARLPLIAPDPKSPAAIENSLITRQANHLEALIPTVNKGDRDLLTIAETIMRVDKLSLAEIVNRGPLWLAERLRQGLPNRHTGKPREIPDPDARARRVYYALDRLKEGNPKDPELPEVECARLPLMAPDPKSSAAIEDSLITRQADHLGALIPTVNKGDRDLLTIAETIMRVDDVPLAEIVNRGPLWLAERLRQGLPSRHTGKPREIPDSDARARRVHYALDRLKEANPNDPELPEVEYARFPLMAPDAKPSAAIEDSLITRQADHLGALIPTAKEGDRDPLTIAETIMRVDNVPLAEIVNHGPLWLAERLRQGLPHRHTGKPRVITDPDARARRVHYALDRLKEGNPEDPELPEIDCKPGDSKLPLMALNLEPPAAKEDIRRWGELSKQERGRETGEGRALDDDSRHSYAYNARLGIAAANQLGLVDESFSVKTLGLQEVASKVLALLDTLFARKIVASITASLLRMNVDLFLMDPEHTANIEYLQAEATRRFPDLGLSAAACLRFEDLLADELKMKSIMDAPKDIMERAYAPSLKPSDRVARASKAVVLQLKLESPGLDATQAAALDADVHLRRVDGVLLLRLPDPRERGEFRWDSCTPAAEELVAEWLELKDRYVIGGSLFFPSEENAAEPQIPRVAMAGVYREFMTATGDYLTFDEIKTLRCYKAVMENPTKLRQIAEAACHKDPRSLARRLRILLSRSQGKAA